MAPSILALLQSYRKLNWAKFEVINKIERDLLPLGIYSEEWVHLQATSTVRTVWPPKDLWTWLKGYKELGTIERMVPIAFIAIYAAELLRQIAKLTYIDEISDAIQGAVPAALLPDGDNGALFRIYAVLAMAKGVGVELEDVHDAWSAWMSGQNPDHRSLRPLAELEPDVQDADRPYLNAIRRVARERGLGG